MFTINVMAKYCGYNGWDDFCASQTKEQSTQNRDDNGDWDSLKKNANKITSFTLQALKNKTGIPYNQTIRRQFIDSHIDAFLTGDYAATVLCAPSGYGKTVGLCHWIEDHIANQAEKGTDDIILFFSSSALMNVFLSGRDLNSWILGLLGYTTEGDLLSLADLEQPKGGNFYLIIDGLDEHAYKPEQFQLLINQLTDVFSLYKFTSWFKLILTMRTATWLNNLHQLGNEQGKWFKGFIGEDENLTVNVPLFSVQEVKELCLNINPNIQNFMALDLAESFNHPLYFQFYYKEHRNDFSLSNLNHVCIHELISTFILNKVYLGQHSTDKIAFLKLLVKSMDLKNAVYSAPKLAINASIKQNYNAFNDLISVGVIRELNISTGIDYQTVVEFSNNNFLQYALARCTMQDNDNLFDETLVGIINETFPQAHKLAVLKWCVIYATKTGQENSLNMLPRADLNLVEKANLLAFLCDLLDKSYSSATGADFVSQYFSKDSSDEFFDYFFGLEFICADYKKVLQTLLKFDLSSRKKVMTYTGLASIAVLELDLPEIAHYLQKLNEFPIHTLQRFPINPVKCIDALYQYMKTGLIIRDFMAEITQFYFNPDLYKGKYYAEKSNELLYSLALYVLAICKSPKKVLRFAKAVQGIYPAKLNVITPYSFFVNIGVANSYYLLKDEGEVQRIHDMIASAYRNDIMMFTPFMGSIFYALKIKKALLKGNFDSVPGYVKSLNELCNASGNKISKAFMAFTILNNANMQNLNPAFYKQLQYENNRILRECGISTDFFIDQSTRVSQLK